MGKTLEVKVGEQYGRLTIIELGLYISGNRRAVRCRCACGNETVVNVSRLVRGVIQSCGCLQKESVIKKNTKHNLSHTRLYSIWQGIIKRCYSNKYKWFCNYGGRGIIMCDTWRNDFMSFYTWAITHGYADDLTIERVDVNGNYCSENCTWIPRKQQPLNQRERINARFGGQRLNIATLARQHGVQPGLVYGRLHLGWSLLDALQIPVWGKRH